MSWAATIYVGGSIAMDYLDDSDDLQADALSQQNAISRDQQKMAREQWDYYKANYQPLEEGVIADAKAAGTPERQEAAAGRAVADVRQQYGISRDVAKRGMERYGLNPSDPTYQSMLLDSNLGEAAATAGSANLARENERNLGYTKMIQALSLGKGLPTDAAANLSRASAGYGNVAAGYGGINRQNMANTYNLTSALSQMPWNKIFSSNSDVIGDRAGSGQLGPAGDYSNSGIVDAANQNGADYFGMKKGGLVRGPGTGTSDSVPKMLSDKEFVVPAKVVKALGTDFFYDLIDKVGEKANRRMGRGNHGA